MNLNQHEQTLRRVRISAVHHGRAKSADPDSEMYIYANLYDAEECGELIISATLDYILKACAERNYIIVK